jgi:hypothetical protein
MPGYQAPTSALPGSQPPPIGGFPQGSWAPEKPAKLALWTIIATGAVALVGIFSALLAAVELEDTKQRLLDGASSNSPATNALGVLSLIAWVGSFVLIAMWIMTIRKNLQARGIRAGGPPAVEWWGWFIPLANFILPFLGMRAVAQRNVNAGVLLGWWLPFCAYWLISIPSIVVMATIVDFSTGEVTDVNRIDDTIPYGFASAGALVVSWIFLVMIVRKTTDRHLED